MGSLYPGTGNFTPIVGKRDSRRRARAIQKHRRPFLPSICLNPADIKSWCINFSHHLNFRAKNLAAVMITDTFLSGNRTAINRKPSGNAGLPPHGANAPERHQAVLHLTAGIK